MEESVAQSVISWYENLEAKAVEFKRYVPLAESNLQTWSPLLAEVIVEAGNIVDSLFRFGADEIQERGREKERNRLNINDFRVLYNERYRLDTRKVILLSEPPEYRVPFARWADNHTPAWWSTYTSLKHDRLQSFQSASWIAAIDSLAAALLSLAFQPALIVAMMRKDWLDYRMNPESLIEHAKAGWKNCAALSLHTSLFALILGGPELPDIISNFRPSHYGASSRLINHFGRL